MFLEVYNFFNSSDKKKLLLLIFFFVLAAFFESLSISLLFPVISIILGGKEILLSNEFLKKTIPENLMQPLVSVNENTMFIFLLVVIILIYVIKNVYLCALHYYSHILIYKFQIKISNNIFKKYALSDYSFFINSNKSELIRNIIDESATFVKRLVYPGIFLISEIITIIFICAVLMLVDFKITLIIAITSLVLGTLIIKMTKKNINTWAAQRQKYASSKYMLLNEFLNLIIEIKLKNLHNFFFKMFDKSNTLHIHADRNADTINLFHRQILELLAVIIFSGILIIAFTFNYKASEIVPLLGVYAAAAFRLMPSLNRVLIYYNNFRYGKVAFKKVKSELNNYYKEIIFNNSKDYKIVSSFDNIDIKNVSFSYGGSQEKIIKNLNFNIEKGKFYGIFGPSGSGKSSLILLITGLLRPTVGRIILNNKYDINLENTNYQSLIGFVGQKTFLLNSTIKKNISLIEDDENIDDDKIERLINEVGLDEFVYNLPDQLNTIIGDDGIRISGGQRQRIAIARALYSSPEFLILDEATSSLDLDNENKILHIIQSLIGKVTIIFISHKLSNLKFCSDIFELNNGFLSNHKNKI